MTAWVRSRRAVVVPAFLAVLFLNVTGAVGGGEQPVLPAIESELPSDPDCCGEAKAVLATIPDLHAAPGNTVKLQTGRKELFLDNYVLASVENVKRQLHQPKKYGPVLRPDQAWEGGSIQIRMGPSWNPEEKLWMLWYCCAGGYANSRDGIHWEKPVLGLQSYKGSKQNNLMVPWTQFTDDSFFDSSGHFNQKIYQILEGDGTNVRPVFYDPNDPDPKRRYKGFATKAPQFDILHPAISADGRKWEVLESASIPSSDEYHLFHDESRNLYVATVKHGGPRGRAVFLSLSKDFEHWTEPRDCLIFQADKRDQELGAEQVRMHLRNPDLRQPVINQPEEYKTEIYNLPVFAYQGVYVGMPTVFNQSAERNSDGFSMVELAVSRDLLQWERVGNREKFIPLSPLEGGKNYDVAQLLAANQPIITDSEIWFYYTGAKWRVHPSYLKSGKNKAIPDTGAICLAKLRLDGFVSLDAGSAEGYVVTKPLLIEGKSLHLNVDAPQGEVQAEILDAAGQAVLPGFSQGNCIPMREDTLDGELKWKKSDLSTLTGKTVRLRFALRDARLYAFWVNN